MVNVIPGCQISSHGADLLLKTLRPPTMTCCSLHHLLFQTSFHINPYTTIDKSGNKWLPCKCLQTYTRRKNVLPLHPTGAPKHTRAAASCILTRSWSTSTMPGWQESNLKSPWKYLYDIFNSSTSLGLYKQKESKTCFFFLTASYRKAVEPTTHSKRRQDCPALNTPCPSLPNKWRKYDLQSNSAHPILKR